MFMGCHKPLKAYRARVGITFVRALSLTGVSFELPCGQCAGCRLERSRQWAVRILNEKRCYSESSFVTLTYGNDFLPPGGTLVKRDLQLFMKRLRKQRGEGIRFFACGEYGDQNKRPHYHVCLLNIDWPDKLRFSQNRRGDPYYTSSSLEKIWKMGHCLVADLTFDSAAYVARYCLGKVTGDKAKAHYCVRDGDGVVYDRIPEFAHMSRNPGIGDEYYQRYGDEIRAHDNLIVNGRPVRPPRFYDTRSEKVDPVRFEQVKRQRKRAGVLARPDNTPERRAVKAEILRRKLEQKGRSL